jgi:transitional endoplasmic reticulum ATPase
MNDPSYNRSPMEDLEIRRERAQNIWTSLARKVDTVAQATRLDPLPRLDLGQIGGLAGPKEEILTYACAATNPEVYQRWGTYPPSGLLLIGSSGVGKGLLARALAKLTESAFLEISVPRLVIEVIHRGGKVGELVEGWSQTLAEMPPLTVFFDELEFSQAQEIGANRPDLPVGPVMDFLLDLVDRTIAAEECLVVGSTSHPDTLRQAFSQQGRFERIVAVSPIFPDDVVEALKLHAADSERRAGHALFEAIDWREVVGQYKEPSTADWIRILHGVLRRKARREAASEVVTPVTVQDLLDEVSRFKQARNRLPTPHGGTYV